MRRQVKPGNALELLQNGAATFPAMLSAMRAATESINLAVYWFSDDAVGQRFADVLKERARDGIEVNLIYDGWGSFETPYEFFEDLEEAGVRVQEHHPILPWRPRWSWFTRDHRKLLVVDGEVAFVGGINICDHEAPRTWGGSGWRDLHVRVAGPAVRDLQRGFLATWRRGGGRRLDRKRYVKPVPACGSSAVHVVGHFFVGRRSIRRSLDRAIKAARRFIYIENAYFLPDDRLLRALRRAVRRGVDVRVVVPGDSDIKVVQWATEALYPKLHAMGVRVFEWRGSVLHSKAVCVDGVWSSIGSFNLDRMSAADNLELAVNALDETFGQALARLMEGTQKGSTEITELPERNLAGRAVDHALLAAARWL